MEYQAQALAIVLIVAVVVVMIAYVKAALQNYVQRLKENLLYIAGFSRGVLVGFIASYVITLVIYYLM